MRREGYQIREEHHAARVGRFQKKAVILEVWGRRTYCGFVEFC